MRPIIPDVSAGQRPSAAWSNQVKDAATHDHSGMGYSDGQNHVLPILDRQDYDLYELTGDPELDDTGREYKATAKPCIPRWCAIDGQGHVTGTSVAGTGAKRYYMDPAAKEETIWFPAGERDGDSEPAAAPEQTTGSRVWTVLYYGIRAVLGGGGGGSKFCLCQLTAAQTGSDASFNVDTVTGVTLGSVPESITSPSSTLTTYNVPKCAGADNAPALIVFNETSGHWEVVWIQNVSQTLVTAWRYDTTSHKFQVKTRTEWGNFAGAESDWTDIGSGQPVSQSVVTDVEDATTYLTHDKKTAYLLEAGTESTDNVVAISSTCP